MFIKGRKSSNHYKANTFKIDASSKWMPRYN